MFLRLQKLYLYLSVILFYLHRSDEHDFCDFDCGYNHIACKKNNCKQNDEDCGTMYKDLPLNDIEIDMVLHLHNTIREFEAKTKPVAANMNVISYNRELEFVARCIANKCQKKPDYKVCRIVSNYDDVGLNTFTSILKPGFRNKTEFIRWAMREWGESKFWQKEWRMHYPFSIPTEYNAWHLIQVIWGPTKYIGCGRIRFGSKMVIRFHIICLYAPSGPFQGKPLAKFGKQCSNCERGEKCNMKYQHLCGDIETLDASLWIPFSNVASMNKYKNNKFIWIEILIFLCKNSFRI